VNTHNTDKCHRYNSDCSKKYHKSKSSGDKKTHTNFSQQFDKTMKKSDKLTKQVEHI
jgi:hypothetical protein